MSTSSAERTLAIAGASLAVGIAVLGLKYLSFVLTGSIALYSDALESIVNLVTAILAIVAIRLSARPADATLPYGYYKAEYFSAVIVGVIIVVAALAIFRQAYFAFLSPRHLQNPGPGLLVNAVATVINGAWAWVLLRQGRRSRSPALTADGRHLVTDVISSAGVLIGVGLATVTGWAVLDPLLATLVALNILWSGWGLIKESVGGLMDIAVPPDLLARIREVIAANADGAIEAHDIRTRQAGRMTFIDFHLVVPGRMSVDDAHGICDRIEQKLRESVEDAQITIHVEPEEKAKHAGIVVI
jgi:cation diffusion facilitator family transporter